MMAAVKKMEHRHGLKDSGDEENDSESDLSIEDSDGTDAGRNGKQENQESNEGEYIEEGE